MKRRHKVYLKLNLMSLVFIVVSFISVTLAWFAYSGLADVSTEVNVKAWYIELDKDGQKVSNDIVISLDDIYPGMETVNELVNIKNKGDSDAGVKYSITSARILGNSQDNFVVDGTNVTSEYVEDLLSHNYPFHININLTKNYALAKTGESTFEVSVSWPLDSDNDELDSLWGSNAYEFEQNESSIKASSEGYQELPSIKIVISVTAEQYIESDDSSDPNYNLGDEILFDVVSNSKCLESSTTCLKTHVIDKNNTLGDTTVTLLPDLTNTYSNGTYSNYSSLLTTETSSWTVNTRALLVTDILNIVSTDVTNSLLIRNNISDLIIGNLNYTNRMTTEINRAINYNGYYTFLNAKFNYLGSSNCYWTNSEYNTINAFAIKAIDETKSKIYGELKTNTCNVVPVIIANKTNL